MQETWSRMLESALRPAIPGTPGIHLDLDHYGRLRGLTNEEIAHGFQWRVPERMNAGIEICDRHADAGRGLAMRWIPADPAERPRDISFAELRARSNRVANVLHAAGVREGDRVFTVLPRIPEHWVVLLGAMKVGAITCCLSTTFGADAVRVRIEDARPSVVFSIAAHRERVAPAATAVGALLIEADDDGSDGLTARMLAASEEFDPVLRESASPAFLFYTSGTTGSPKGSLHGSDMLAGVLALLATAIDLRPDDVFWPTSDLGWVTGFIFTFGALAQGRAFMTLQSDFDADRWVRLLATEGVTNFFAVPTAYRMMRASPTVADPSLQLRIRRMGSVGEPLDPTTLDWARSRFGCEIFEVYGQTEHGAGACTNRASLPIRPGSLGKPLPYLTVALLDDHGNEVSVGEQGEICTRADYPALFKGYLNRPEQTLETCRDDGWHHSGDLAHRDEDGYLWFDARADDVISSGGYRIGPSEVENALLSHRAVREAAVVGKVDEQRGQIVKAWVVVEDGITADDDLAADLQSHCKQHAGGWNYPREVAFIAELPRTVTGKVRRVDLRALDD